MTLPSLSPLSGNILAGDVVQVPAPPRFRGVRGTPRDVEVTTSSRPGTGASSSQKAGVRYEEKAQDHLREVFPFILNSPVVNFIDDSGFRTCIPDALLVYPPLGRTVIFEIKIQHMPESWWQLKRLYEPVMKAMYPSYDIQVVEVCRSVDASMPFPCKIELIDDLERFARFSPASFGVYHWKP